MSRVLEFLILGSRPAVSMLAARLPGILAPLESAEGCGIR
jgi:hypothetical protein